MKVVHIVNGDSTAILLRSSGLPGDIIIWREMLCEGSLYEKVATQKFYAIRSEWFKEQPSLKRFDYNREAMPELDKIHDLSTYDEVVLWFEYDLFCQVNLLAVGSVLHTSYSDKRNYSLVCTGFKYGFETLQTLADHEIAEFAGLFASRMPLEEIDLKFLARVWLLFANVDIHQLYHLPDYHKFPYLKPAMHQHLERFREDEDGLTEIGRQIVHLVDSGIKTKNGVIHKLLHWQKEKTVYGFGDLQYEMELYKLEDFLDQNHPGFIWDRS